MVAAVSAWHERHRDAAAEIERRLDRGDVMVAAGPALVEAYAVLTRLPAPHRLTAADAHALLQENFAAGQVATLDGDGYRALLRQALDAGIAGGQTYDAVIVACAEAGGAEVLLTLNLRHFERFASRGLTIVVPAAAGR